MKETEYYFTGKTICTFAGKDDLGNVISIIKGKNVETVIKEKDGDDKKWRIIYRNGDERIVTKQDFYNDISSTIDNIKNGDKNIDNDYMVPVKTQIGNTKHNGWVVFTIPEEYKNKIDISNETEDVIVNISNKEIGYDYNRICINFVPYDVNDNTKWRGNRSVSRLVPLLQDMVQIVNKYDPGMKETLLNVHYKIYYEGIYGIKTVSVKELLELDVKSNKRRYDFESFLLIPGYEHELNLRDISDEDIEVLKSITKSLGILMDEYYYKNEVARIVR